MDATPDEPRLRVERVDRIDSTNSELLRREPLLPSGTDATAVWLIAAEQARGRGRRQRSWLSNPRGSLTASLGYEVSQARNLGLLSLVAGVAVAEALAAFGSESWLKWPNDIHAGDGKAGGILCEARARGGATRIVVGCGLNLLPPDPSADFGQPVTGLFEPATLPDRARLETAMGVALLAACMSFHEQGFDGFRQRWHDRDLLRDRAVLIHDDNGVCGAIARGIDSDGALLVEVEGHAGALRRLLSEEVSVRTLPS